MDLVSLIIYGIITGLLIGLIFAVRILLNMSSILKLTLKKVERLEKQIVKHEEEEILLMKKLLKKK